MMLNTVSRLETEEGESEQFTLTKMRIHEMMDDKKAAYNELKSLVEQHPLDMQYKTMLGNWLMQHDRQKEAFKYFTDVLKEEPDNSYARCRYMIITMPPGRRIWRMACSIRF